MAVGDRKVLANIDYVDLENNVQDSILQTLNTTVDEVKNVEKDWNETNPLSPKYIKNKPDIFNNIEQLADMNVTNISDGQILMWNSTSSKWENQTIPSSTDIDTTGAVANNILINNGTKFAPNSLKTINSVSLLGTGNITIPTYTQGDSAIVINSGNVCVNSACDTKWSASTDVSSKQDILVSGTNIKTINGSSILGSGDIVIEGGVSGVSGGAIRSQASYSATAGQTIFTLNFSGSNVDVYINGIKMDLSEYIIGTNQITLLTGADLGDNVELVGYMLTISGDASVEYVDDLISTVNANVTTIVGDISSTLDLINGEVI